MVPILSIISLGVGLIAGGFFYQLFDDIITDFFTPYVYDATSSSYLGSLLMWDAIPYVMLFGGVACLLYAGMKYNSGGGR